ncbi:hypothetical protein [Neisseria sp.]|uniref:hypothetical protein n=1 Tax=Neisseria sp. TaxID=192066 RepID=UPI0035A133FE
MKFIKMFTFSLFFGTSLYAQAHTSMVKEFTCPIGGEKFEQGIDTSGTSFGMETDMRPIGMIAAPWRIPVCPGNKFVIFKDDFTSDELEKFKKVINSKEYQSIAEKHSSYFLWGRMMEMAGENSDAEQMMWIFLQSSWQGGSKESLEKTLEYADKALAKNAFKEDEKRFNTQFLRGEMLRKLGRFDEAKQTFMQLQNNKIVQKHKTFKPLAKFQLELVEKKDTMSHRLDFD